MRGAALIRWLPVAAITGLALALRVWGIGAQSLWTDELYSVTHIHDGFERILLAGFRTEPNPPLYFVLLRLWCGLFGDGDVTARMLSAILSAASVPFVYAAGAVVAGRRAGLIAALLMALAVLQIEFGQDARQYALLVLGLSVALLGLAMALSRPTAASVAAPGALFAAGVVTATYSHNIGVIYWFAMDLCLLLHVVPVRRRRPARSLLAWAACNLLAAAACAPQFYAMVLFRHADGWIPAVSPATLLTMVKAVLFTYLAPDTAIGVAGVGVSAAGVAWAVVASRREPLVLSIGAALPALCVGGIVAASLGRPVMLVQTMLFVPVPMYLLLGSALAGVGRRDLRVAGIAAALAVEVAAMLVFWPRFAREPWREIVPLLARKSGPTDAVILLSPEAMWAFGRYWPAASPVPPYVPMPAPRRSWEALGEEQDDGWLAASLATVRHAVPEHGAVWLLARWDMAPALRRLNATLAGSLVVQTQVWDRANYPILLTRIARAPAPVMRD